MKKIIFVFLSGFLNCFFTAGILFAANIYVDNTLPVNCVSWNYSIASRDCNGSDGNAYTTVQIGLDAMNKGDALILRGGTYQEGHITMPRSINGTAWTAGNYNTIKSYDGEWAVLDGQNNCSPDTPSRGSVIGYATFSPSDLLSYWKFERIEIKNGSSPDRKRAAGFFGWGGPFWFRYCYIHDNLATTGSYNPGGLVGHRWNNCIIEYCRFKDNGMLAGTNHNCAHINIYSDYIEDPANVDINQAVRKNIIRYNYFSNSPIGVKYKNSQWLSLSNTGTHITYNAYGDKIHHNIFDNLEDYAVDARQDFVQVYNNIFYNATESTYKKVGIGEQSSGDREPFYSCVYNNTLIKTRLGFFHDNEDGDDNSSYPFTDGIHPHLYCYNNIIENVSTISSVPPLSVAFTWSDWAFTDVTMNTVTIENNLFVPNASTDSIITVGPYKSTFSADTYESGGYSAAVYTNASTVGLRTGYKTNGDYVIEGIVTIADGGIGGNHPYLSGVTIPSYIGATNPNDNSWVDGVLSLATTDILKAGVADDPTWIEGGGASAVVGLPGSTGNTFKLDNVNQ